MGTAAALCRREACERICALVVVLGDASAKLAKRHADTPMLARTLLQPAAPVPFLSERGEGACRAAELQHASFARSAAKARIGTRPRREPHRRLPAEGPRRAVLP